MKLLFPFILAGGLLSVLAQPPSPQPKPGPEHQKLRLWSGVWAYEGEAYSTFLGPGGKFSGTMTGRLTAGGFGLECVFSERGPWGETRIVEMDGYDPVAKNYPYLSVASNSNIYRGAFTVQGTVAKWEGVSIVNGKQYRDRGTDAVSPDGMNIDKRGELSQDGKTWVPSFSFRARKLTPIH
jgi:hypothetical protein